MHRGNQHFAQWNFGDAIADFNNALELDPNNADLYFRRGMAYRSIGNADRAVLEFRRALELSSADSHIHSESSKELQRLKPTPPIVKPKPTDNAQSYAPSKPNDSLSQGVMHLLVWSTSAIVIWSILLMGNVSPQSVEHDIYLRVFLTGGVLVVVLTILWRFAKPKVLFAVAILVQLIGVILLINQWVFNAKQASEAAVSESQSRQLAVQSKQQAERLNDGLITDEARRAGKVIWPVGAVQNRTTQAITYYILNEDATWQRRTLQPNQSEVFWKKGIDITIKFNSGKQEKQYILDTSPIVDRPPDDPAKSNAPVNYFSKNSEGQVELYSARPGRIR